MLFYLLLGGLARICRRFDGLDLSVDVRLYVDFLTPLTVLDIEEHVFATHILIGHGAEASALLARSYGMLGSWPPADYSLAPCRVKLDRLNSPT